MGWEEVSRPQRKSETAIALRVAGATLEEIAQTLNYPSKEAAENAINGSLAGMATEDDKRKARTLARMRYERLLRGLWPTAVNSESAQQLPYARAAREIVDKIVALDGAAAPAEIMVHTPTTEAIHEWVAQVVQIKMPVVEEHDPFVPQLEGEVIDAEFTDETVEHKA